MKTFDEGEEFNVTLGDVKAHLDASETQDAGLTGYVRGAFAGIELMQDKPRSKEAAALLKFIRESRRKLDGLTTGE